MDDEKLPPKCWVCGEEFKDDEDIIRLQEMQAAEVVNVVYAHKRCIPDGVVQ